MKKDRSPLHEDMGNGLFLDNHAECLVGMNKSKVASSCGANPYLACLFATFMTFELTVSLEKGLPINKRSANRIISCHVS